MQDIREAPAVAEETVAAWDVQARFRSPAALNQAIKTLEISGFGRESLGLPEVDPPADRATPEAGSQAADTGTEAQQSRIAHAAIGGAIAAMIGALVAAASGGGMGAMAGAAIGAGIVVAIIAELISRALSHATQANREDQAAHGKLVLAVRAVSPAQRERALGVLRDAGGEVLSSEPENAGTPRV